MTGPEHYAEAERILDHAEEEAMANSDEWYANAMAAAQVHATLAQTAATIAVAQRRGAGDVARVWDEAVWGDRPYSSPDAMGPA